METFFKQIYHEKKAHMVAHLWPFVFMVALMMGIYVASVTVPAGWLTYGLSAIPLMVLAVTALARLNDISPAQSSKRWQVRRGGMILVGTGAIGLLVGPLLDLVSQGAVTDFPSWREVMIRWGVALTWVTTPHMPPWWRYITGEYKTLADAKAVEVSLEVGGTYIDPAAVIVPPDSPLLRSKQPWDGRERRNPQDY